MKVIALEQIRWRGRLRAPGSALGLLPASVEAKLAKGSVRLPTEEELQTWPSELPDDEDDLLEEELETSDEPESQDASLPDGTTAPRPSRSTKKTAKKAAKKTQKKR